MVNIHCAYSEQINPTGATPLLTRDQIWRGLQRKIRKPQDFVPVIEGGDVLEDKEDEVVRVAHFKEMPGKAKSSVKEVCKSFYPTKVDFIQPSGAVITNTISDGPGLTENDYIMTYTFEWRHPELTEGSEEAKQMMATRVKEAQTAVHSSILSIRKMAANGELD